MLEEIEEKHKKVIAKAVSYMSEIKDYEHDENHLKDVVFYTKKLLNTIPEKSDPEVCLLSAYWHDVGRLYGRENHEKKSAEMLKEEFEKNGYPKEIIDKCILAIKDHNWMTNPTTIEGKIIRDADKLAWLGRKRWRICIEKKQRLDSILENLHKLKDEILYFEESKKIYEREIINLVKLLHEELMKDR